jgi:hypothetical protein
MIDVNRRTISLMWETVARKNAKSKLEHGVQKKKERQCANLRLDFAVLVVAPQVNEDRDIRTFEMWAGQPCGEESARKRGLAPIRTIGASPLFRVPLLAEESWLTASPC